MAEGSESSYRLTRQQTYSLRNELYIAIDKRRTHLVDRLCANSAPRRIMSTRPYLLEDHVQKIEIPNKKNGRDGTRFIKSDRQIELYREIYEDPFHKPYVFCVSSYPNDEMAKLLALKIMMRAAVLAVKKKMSGFPVWHTVYEGFKDDLRDETPVPYPCLLTLSNIPSNSSPLRLGKIRDNLEKFSDIPRIVVLSKENPVKFFRNSLEYPINGAVFLASKNNIVI